MLEHGNDLLMRRKVGRILRCVRELHYSFLVDHEGTVQLHWVSNGSAASVSQKGCSAAQPDDRPGNLAQCSARDTEGLVGDPIGISETAERQPHPRPKLRDLLRRSHGDYRDVGSGLTESFIIFQHVDHVRATGWSPEMSFEEQHDWMRGPQRSSHDRPAGLIKDFHIGGKAVCKQHQRSLSLNRFRPAGWLFKALPPLPGCAILECVLQHTVSCYLSPCVR